MQKQLYNLHIAFLKKTLTLIQKLTILLYIASSKKTLALIQKYLYINCSLSKDIVIKIIFLNLLFHNFPYQNHQKNSLCYQ